MNKFIFITFFLLYSLPSFAVTRTVTVFNDLQQEGTLRAILQEACDVAGDDDIVFAPTRLPEIRIALEQPLVVPDDCQGRISITGSHEVDTLIDGSNLVFDDDAIGAACSVYVYFGETEIDNLSFVRNRHGAGLCLFGEKNKASNNRFGITKEGIAAPNKQGIVVSNAFQDEIPALTGGEAQINDNLIQRNNDFGIWIQADDAQVVNNKITRNRGEGIVGIANEITIVHNDILSNGRDGIAMTLDHSHIISNLILANGSCPPGDLLSSQEVPCLGAGTMGSGILLWQGSTNNRIGGIDFDGEAEPNTIQYNRNGGVVILGNHVSNHNWISRNIISKNYGDRVDIDLLGDGVSFNDYQDEDTGPNLMQNFSDYLQCFPLVAPGHRNHFWCWGVELTGKEIELYQVSPEDYLRTRSHGGGDAYLKELEVNANTFETTEDDFELFTPGDRASTLTHINNITSEFALTIAVDNDTDLDGIIDELETGDGTPATQATNSNSADSDGDGLPDSVEDRNRNGIYEPELGETQAYNNDTDGDGLNDWAELGGDGVYNEGADTNPWKADTDEDGIDDGDEDTDGDGIWEGYLGETSALLADSDGDGFVDGSDTCPMVYNLYQEHWYCSGS